MAPAAWVALGAVIRALYWWAAYNARSCNLRLIMIGAGCQNVTYWRNVFWDQLRLLISLHFPRPSPDTFWCHTPRDAGCASASICSFSLRAFLSLTCTADDCVHQDVAWELFASFSILSMISNLDFMLVFSDLSCLRQMGHKRDNNLRHGHFNPKCLGTWGVWGYHSRILREETPLNIVGHPAGPPFPMALRHAKEQGHLMRKGSEIYKKYTAWHIQLWRCEI